MVCGAPCSTREIAQELAADHLYVKRWDPTRQRSNWGNIQVNPAPQGNRAIEDCVVYSVEFDTTPYLPWAEKVKDIISLRDLYKFTEDSSWQNQSN